MTLWPEFERGLREAVAMTKSDIYCSMCEVRFSVTMHSDADSSWTVDYCPYCGDDLSEQSYDAYNDQWQYDDAE